MGPSNATKEIGAMVLVFRVATAESIGRTHRNIDTHGPVKR